MALAASPDVYFPIEITSREYAGHLLLAVELAARGLNCLVGFKGAVQRAMKKSSTSGVLFYKGGDKGDWRNATIHSHVGLDPEAGIVYDDFADFFDKRHALHDMSTTVVQFCFGPDDHAVFSDRFPESPGRFHMTGAPRVSLWGQEGASFYADQVSHIEDRYGTIILFTSSGGFTHEHYLRTRGQNAGATWGTAESAHHFLSFARQVAASLPETSVVIRPHPSDSWSAWHAATSDIRNLAVESDLDLSAWVRASTLVVHPGTSTAALEAVCAGIPAISTASNRKSNVASSLSYLAATTQDVTDFHARSAGDDLPVLPSDSADSLLRRKLHHPIPGAAQRVADVLMETFDFAGPSGIAPSRRRPLRAFPFSRQSGRLPELGRSTPPPFKRNPLLKPLVERDVDAAQRILHSNAKIDVQQSEANCFLIRPAH